MKNKKIGLITWKNKYFQKIGDESRKNTPEIEKLCNKLSEKCGKLKKSREITRKLAKNEHK